MSEASSSAESRPWAELLISPLWDRRLEKIIELKIWDQPLILIALLLLSILPTISIVTAPLSLTWQSFFGLGTLLMAIWINRIPGRLAMHLMIVLSVLVSTRYMYWRVTQSVGLEGNTRTWGDVFFAGGLIAAEAYAFIVLLLGYFQVLWPLNRKPVPLPRDTDDWPTVDIYIPTYNEPLKVVRPTILAALEMDWPKEKLNVYVLDDGKRPHFKDLCDEIGAVHITRTNSKHAKAGNLNAALPKTKGEFIAIFDCDHIPTRSFLQVSLGWFLREPELAMTQTPHHFFSPDPFERNLGTFRKVPNEGELFYGLLQDGNDFWNATFFCGSCAVIRRTALEDVGGIAVETVTEDAHTALKMHRRGWTTAYLNVAQAAGLATESLSAHVGQRIRWARGMAQIFRTDNPFLGKGLKIGQRLCYSNAMLHFFYGLPRVVFLTAPLSYLFFQAHIIEASALLIAAYALPHLAHASITNSRIQGPYRHSFWAEVYETVLATYILIPTLLALINPKLGTFNVTAKGGMNNEEYFDRDIAKPYVVLLIVNLVGLLVGAVRFLYWNTHEVDTVVLNIIWTIYNSIIIGAALAVAWESRQVRRSIRVNALIDARVRIPDGPEITGVTMDISEGGTGIKLVTAQSIPAGAQVLVALAPEYRVVWTPSKVIRSKGNTLFLEFIQPMSLDQERQLIYAIFGRADAWVSWSADRPTDRIGESFRSVLEFGLIGALRIVNMTIINMRNSFFKTIKHFASMLGLGAAKIVLALLVATAAGGYSQTLSAQEPIAIPTVEAPTQDALTQETLNPEALAPVIRATSRQISLAAMGVQKPIRLRGVQGEITLPLAVREDELVTKARFTLKFAHSPSLIFPLSHINVLVNNELAATIPLSAETAGGAERIIDIDPRLFVEYNQIGLQLIAHYTMDCEDPVHTTLWSIVDNRSTLELETRELPRTLDLSRLPQPFFDSRDSRRVTLPFVFAGTPTTEQMDAAGVIASWFGALADYRGASFPVYINKLPSGHAVVFVTGNKLPAGLELPADNAAAKVQLLINPRAPDSLLLVVRGATAEGIKMAARGLALDAQALSGKEAFIKAFEEPPVRQAYDVPRWLPTDRPVRFSELTRAEALAASGLYPDVIRVPFHAPPDLFTWRGKGLELDLKYRYTPTIGPKSTLNVNINNAFVEAIALSHGGEEKAAEQRINLPFVSALNAVNSKKVYVPDYKFSSDNNLEFHYYFERKKEGACKDVVLDNLRGSIDEDSTIDLTAFPHYTALPDLALFANAGFPFTKYADLSQTAIVLPENLSAEDVEAYLTVLGHLGKSTGYPAIRFALGRAADVESFEDHDLILLGGAGNQPLLESWADSMPMALVSGDATLKTLGPIQRLRAKWQGRNLQASADHAGRVIVNAGPLLGTIMSFESPLSSSRTAVAITAASSKRLTAVTGLISDPGKAQFVRGDLVLFNGEQVNNYLLGEQYYVGSLPLTMHLRWWFSRQPLGMLVISLLVSLLLATMLYRVMRKMAAARKKN